MTEKRDDLYLPSREFVEQAHIQSRAEYERMWKQSIEDPDTFWGYIAKDFHWFKPWTQVYRGEPEIGDNEWFVGGTVFSFDDQTVFRFVVLVILRIQVPAVRIFLVLKTQGGKQCFRCDLSVFCLF